jgi:hypothetical protein
MLYDGHWIIAAFLSFLLTKIWKAGCSLRLHITQLYSSMQLSLQTKIPLIFSPSFPEAICGTPALALQHPWTAETGRLIDLQWNKGNAEKELSRPAEGPFALSLRSCLLLLLYVCYPMGRALLMECSRKRGECDTGGSSSSEYRSFSRQQIGWAQWDVRRTRCCFLCFRV